MSRLTPFPIAGGSYKDDTLPWSAQDTVNWLPVKAEHEGTTSPVLLRGVPGLQTVVGGAQTAGLPVRGGYDADGFCVVVIGQSLYRFDGKATTLLGTIPGIQRVQFAHNQVAGGIQIAIATGTGGYVYDTAAQTLAPITDDGFPGAKSFAYMDSYIIGVDPTGNFWFNSDLADAASYNTLNRYEAESEPDRIQTLLVSHEDVVIFGARTTEFWYDSGANINTFQRRDGTGFEIGCVSPHAAVNLDNTVYWRGHDGSAYRLNGYTAQRISTGPIEQDWAKSDPSQCFAMTFVDRGHKIVYWTQPDGKTWGYDVATGEWHRRASHLMERWRANCLFRHRRTWYAGDYTNGRLYALGWKVNTEGAQPLVAERTTTVMQDDRNRFRFNAVEVVMDAQESAPPVGFKPLAIRGHIPDGTVGDVVDYTYTVSGGAVPYGDVTEASGAFPSGLSMDATAHVTGDFTAGGTFTPMISVTDAAGTIATLQDTIKVKTVDWWLTASGDPSHIWISQDPRAWSDAPVSISPVIVTPGFGAKWMGGDVALIVGPNAGIARTATLSGGPITTTAATIGTNTNVLWADAGAFAASNGSSTWYTSIDNGITWQAHIEQAGLNVYSIVRLDSGRWIAFRELGANQEFVYSDEAIPTTWTTAASAAVQSEKIIVTNGAVAVAISTLSDVWRTTDGATWVEVPVTQILAENRCATAHGDTFIMVGQPAGANPGIWRSSDAGMTWAAASAPATTYNRVEWGGGYWVASDVAGGIHVSIDDGLSWTLSTLPSVTGAVNAGHVEYVP